jgi:AcrR family transcriptional regulator
MRKSRPELVSIRREQIVDAATAVIAEQGIQNLSLSAIEQKAGMARGQLTYYFRTKEDILLGVFDRALDRIHECVEQHAARGLCPGCPESGWEWVRLLLTLILTKPPMSPEFGCLQYTFLAQVGHREDFRRRLATLYDRWRSDMAGGLAADVASGRSTRPVAPRAMATVVQALLHGLGMQSAADPGAFDRQEVLDLCLDMLGTYLGVRTGPPAGRKEGAGKSSESPRNGRHAPASAARRAKR